MVQKYLLQTHAPTHHQYKLELEHVWAVRREGEAELYAPFATDPNRMLLWHGSRTTNFAGILGQGLRIAPPEAPVTGYMFGKGVYCAPAHGSNPATSRSAPQAGSSTHTFGPRVGAVADMSSKSANYCAAKRGAPCGLLLLSEVALGASDERKKAHYVEKLPAGKLSCKGLGRTAPDPAETVTTDSGAAVPLGAPKPTGVEDSSLLYNEYIVYDTAQISCKFLCQVKFVFE